MKRFNLPIIYIFTFIAVVGAAMNAFGATYAGSSADAGAFIDYDYITFEFTNDDGTAAGEVQNDYLRTFAQVTGETQVTDDLEAYAASDYSYAWGEAIVDIDNEDYDISATAGVTDPFTNESAAAYSAYYGTFAAETAGTLTITIDYYLTASAQAGEDLAALANAMVLLVVGDDQISDSIEFFVSNDNADTIETQWLTLTLSCDLAADESVDFTILAQAEAQKTDPVPVPGSLMILCTGLAGLAGIKRR